MDILCDIDGTLADLTHRRHHVREKPKNWPAFFDGMKDDGVHEPVRNVIRDLWESHHRVFFCSGRNEAQREVTCNWLNVKACLWNPDMVGGSFTGEYALSIAEGPKTGLFMRKDGDYRSDDIVKEEILDHMLLLDIRPAIVFDDRDRVVKMWRRRGIICAQVAEGDF